MGPSDKPVLCSYTRLCHKMAYNEVAGVFQRTKEYGDIDIVVQQSSPKCGGRLDMHRTTEYAAARRPCGLRGGNFIHGLQSGGKAGFCGQHIRTAKVTVD